VNVCICRQEIIVSRMRFISCQTSNPIRFVGLSTALANPRDLADWLGIGTVGVYKYVDICGAGTYAVK
jgi:activating signal cointegrator complex subunit 3